MTGTAKLFLETISVANYENLCGALVEEFDEKLSSIDIHQKLTKRRKRDEENFHQYVLEMRKLAALVSIEEKAVIRYIVNGLRMRDDLKYPLYSATTYKELRERYDLKQQMSTKQNERNTQKHNDINYDTHRQHCFNCGSTAHALVEFIAETKCFKCNGSGHIGENCAKQNQVMSIVRDNKRSKQMLIGNKAATCLIDTGTDVSLMRECFYKNYFSNIALQKSAAKLFGLGNTLTRVKGALITDVKVDDVQTEHTLLVVSDADISFEAEEKYNCLYNVVEGEVDIDVMPRYKQEINKLIQSYKPTKTPTQHPIQLKVIPKEEHIAFNENPTRLSAMERAVVKRQVDEWLQQGMTRESSSNVASKVVLAKKKDGSYRVCIDYRKLNAAVLKDRFPVPIIDEVLEKIQAAKFYILQP